MSDPHPLLNPHRSLRRAANISSANDGNSPVIAENRKRGLGASIRRKFEDLTTSKLGRSKSLNDAPFSAAQLQKNVFGRSRGIVGSEPRSPPHLERSRRLSQTELPSWVLPATTSPQPMENIVVPELIQRGTLMTKVSSKRHKNLVLRVDADLGQIIWESKQQKISGCQMRYFGPGFSNIFIQSL
jgi:phosphatidylinositol phospholipase C delta